MVNTCTMQAQGSLVFEGHQGLMLVSKQPIENKDYLHLDSFVTQRGVLYGEIDGVQVACTHLSTPLPLPYGG